MINLNTRVSDLTVEQLLAVIRGELSLEPSTVSGIQGIADIFGVSLSQAKRIKASGIISKAISQRGRTILTDVKLARKLWAEGTHGRTL